MLRSNPDLDNVLDKIDSLLRQLNDPTLENALVTSLFAEISALFDQILELRRRLKTTSQ